MEAEVETAGGVSFDKETPSKKLLSELWPVPVPMTPAHGTMRVKSYAPTETRTVWSRVATITKKAMIIFKIRHL